MLVEFNRKRNEIWIDKGTDFHIGSMKSWLEKNAIEMYSIYKKVKSVVAERCVRTLKDKFYKYMTSISKNVYIDILDDIYIDFNKKNNNEGLKFKVGDNDRILKY